MGKLRAFIIELDNPQGVFFAGNCVSGRLYIELDAEMNMREIRLKFKGAANVYWTESRTTGTGSKAETVTDSYSAHETYFEQRVPVFGKGVGMGSENSLPPGEHFFPFSLQLPPTLPSSFEGGVGYVRYTIKGTIDKPWKFDHDTKRPFTVTSLLDLNTYPNATSEVRNLHQKYLCCLCCRSGPISGLIKLDRSGYVPGEMIPFNAEIQNMSSRDCAPSLKLNMVTLFHATTSTKTTSQEIIRMNHQVVPAGETEIWADRIQVPPLPPSFLMGCSIIDINYNLELTIAPSGPAYDLKVPVPIIIGTIPLYSVVQQYQTQYETSLQEQAPPNVPPGAETSLTQLPMPPPSYSECVFGKTNIREEDDSEHTRGEMDYAPAYTYYDWSKQSQFNLKI